MWAVAEKNNFFCTVFHCHIQHSACICIPCKIIFILTRFLVENIKAFRASVWISDSAGRVFFFTSAYVVTVNVKTETCFIVIKQTGDFFCGFFVFYGLRPPCRACSETFKCLMFHELVHSYRLFFVCCEDRKCNCL